jgi:glioma pathogenesis-related protein 2
MGKCFSRQSAGQATAEDGLSAAELRQFRKECLDAHNQKRAQHGAPKMKYDAALNAKAQAWARHMASNGALQHSSKESRQMEGKGYVGENIASDMFGSSNIDDVKARRYTGAQVVDQWYNEISKYDFSNAGSSSGTGHFTQVVWCASKELGVGIVRRQTGNQVSHFVVANYAPGGNFGGASDYQTNVKPHK